MSINWGNKFEFGPEDYPKVSLVVSSSEDGSVLLNCMTGKRIELKQRLPEGFMCIEKNGKYYYDIHCVDFRPARLTLPSGAKVHAYYGLGCRVKPCMDGCRVEPEKGKKLFDEMDKVYQSCDDENAPDYISLKDYAADKVNKETNRMNCWITPSPDIEGEKQKAWSVAPYEKPAEAAVSHSKTLEQLMAMGEDKNFELGIVVSPGKIAVGPYLINCPLEFQLGSTRLCEYSIIDVNQFQMAVLTDSRPTTIDKKYIETWVTGGGNVLISTVVGRSYIGKGKHKIEAVDNCAWHPFLGRIFFSKCMLWSAPNLKVIIGPTYNSRLKFIQSLSTRIPFTLKYHLLAFHDGKQYWRVPDVPQEMYDQKNFLIENGCKLWGENYLISPPRLLHPPPLIRESAIEGRFISDHLIKHSEFQFQYAELDPIEVVRRPGQEREIEYHLYDFQQERVARKKGM